MAPHDNAPTEEHLLRDLVTGLSAPGSQPVRSVGILGCAKYAPQPPTHCLHACLGGDPGAVMTRGCPFLQAAGRNTIDCTSLQSNRCAKGFEVVAQPTSVGGTPAVLVTVEGKPVVDSKADAANPLLEHLDAAARLVQRVDQILEENAGFANEVLQNYEQLNLIFELTQAIAQVTEARAIEALLLQRVGHLLRSQAICIVTHDDEWRGCVIDGSDQDFSASEGVLDPDDLMETLTYVRQTRQVRIATLAGRQIIAGPLTRLDDKIDVVLAVRPESDEPFSAGDVMLVESILTFGGQIISNSELHERLRHMSIEVTRALVAAIDKKDHYTSGHSERGGFLTRLVAEELGVPPSEQQIMEWAGLLHDVGKIGIPEEILCKPGKLTDEEYEIIKQHPRMGYDILKPIASFELVLNGVLYHHEHPDGSGYPEGLQGDEIPLVARIIHVVDTFDALTSTRSYRKAFTIEKAMDIIRQEMGKRIDAEAAEAFFRAFERYRREDPEDFDKRFPIVAQQREVTDAIT